MQVLLLSLICLLIRLPAPFLLRVLIFFGGARLHLSLLLLLLLLLRLLR
jgi:hypothetical protein